VEEVFFDCRFDRQRHPIIESWKLVGTANAPGLRNGDPEFLREFVRVLLVPRPLHRVPGRSGNSKVLRQLRSIAGKRGHMFVPGRKQNPTLKPEPATNLEYSVKCGSLVPQVTDPNHLGDIPGKLRDGGLVIQDINRNSTRAKAPGDTQTRVIASDDQCSNTIVFLHV